MRLPVYLDYMATTPLEPRVKAKMEAYWLQDGCFGNPAANAYSYGLEARCAVELARAQLAAAIGADAKEIVWTAGATEANNLAIKGAADFYKRKGKHIITSTTEHKAVLGVCAHLETQGYEVTYLTPNTTGIIDPAMVLDAVRSDTILVSLMLVNNEIGVVQDIASIAKLIKPRGIMVHVDAAQAVGKIPVNVNELGADLISFSAHKVYGPKGCGALYVRHKPRVRLTPLVHGGGQEFGLRAGTLAVPLIVGMGEAFTLATQELEVNCQRIAKLRDRLWSGIESLGDVVLNGAKEPRVVHNLNVSFCGVIGEDLFADLSNLAVASGSACMSASIEPSHVLRAIGVSNSLAFSSMRLSLGNFTTGAEIDYAIAELQRVVTNLRK